MQWTVGQSDLAGALQKAIRLVAPQNTMPILSGVQLTAENATQLHVETTDLTHAVRVTLEAVIAEPGTVVLPAGVLHNLVQKIPTAAITLLQEAPGQSVVVRYGERNHVTLQPFGTDTLPMLGGTEDMPEWEGTFAAGEWTILNRQMPFACAKDESRPILKGIAAQAVNGQMEWVATDGSRLSWRRAGIGTFPTHILTTKWMQEVARMNQHDAVTVAFYPTTAVAATMDGQTTLRGRYLAGEFPAYQRVIPTDFPTTLTVERDAFLAMVGRLVALQGKDRGVPLELFIESDAVRGMLHTPNTGQMEEWIEGTVNGDPLHVLFNPQFLDDAVRVFDGETITIAFGGDQAPAKIFDPQDPTYFHLVLPLRKIA